MVRLKNFSRKFGGSFCLFALILCACEELPEYCGDGRFDFNNQFCFNGQPYYKCGGKEYDPEKFICDNEVIKPDTSLTYVLTANVTPTGGGTVSRSPNAASYSYGTHVTVTATPASGYTFTGWSGAAAGTDNPLIVTVNGNKTLTANFEQLPTDTYALTTIVSPTGGGTVSRSPNETSYNSGTQVTVTATPANGYTFTGWTGAATGATNPLTVTVNENKTLTANFTIQSSGGSFVYGGQTYGTKVMPDGKTWMTENLNYQPTSGNSWCYDCNTYGRLYDWNTAMTVCPTDWHLPSDEEWNDLVSAVGTNSGIKLKSTSGWQVYEYDESNCISYDGCTGTDSHGFSALPGGFYWIGGYDEGTYIDSGFYGVGYHGYWWTATESIIDGYAYSNHAYFWYMNSDEMEADNEDYPDKSQGLSVRCVKD